MSQIKSYPISKNLAGEIRVPGDKSISHRAVMLSALAEGQSQINGLLEGEDVLATLAAFQAMGVNFDGPTNGQLSVQGVGMGGLHKPNTVLDMGNSGTAMRLIAGILAVQKFESTLVGDESLSKRPMRRVTEPLNSMGANCLTQSGGVPPIQIKPSSGISAINYRLPVASAQIKSSILLAALSAKGTTTVTEPAPTRDHTERMLLAYGYQCQVEKLNDLESEITVAGGGKLTACDIDVPADISSAAFFMVAAAINRGSELTLKHVGVNPTRVGIITILQTMGANLSLHNPRDVGGEPVADIVVKGDAQLQGIIIEPELVPLAIDEFPIICIAAACANGVTEIRGAEELRHKESDRISAMVQGLQKLGIQVVEFADGLNIHGGQFTGGTVQSFDDHRIAMSFAIAGSVSKSPIDIQDCQNITTSFPNFIELATQIGLQLNSSD